MLMEAFMKRLIIAVIFFSILIPSSAFALVNVEAYGGYSFGGEISDVDAESVKGLGGGFRGHYYDEIAIIGWGAGLYAQFSPLEYDATIGGQDVTVAYDKTTYGVDGFITLNVPLIPLHPYLRAGMSIYDNAVDEYTLNGSKYSTNETEYFNMYYGGIGFSMTVLPLPVISVQVFAEYLYEYSKSGDQTLKNHRINVGTAIRI